jgi:hypothetical protein
VPDPLDYHKPTRKPDPFWFELLCAVGCAFGFLVFAIVILDRFFGVSFQVMLRRLW